MQMFSVLMRYQVIENCQVLNVGTKCQYRFLVTLKSAFY